MNASARISVLLGTLALFFLPLPSAAFQDLLDTPATKSVLASRGLLNGIALAGPRLVAVGQRGHILYSDDQGKTWMQAAVPVSSDLTAVSFPSPKAGWAVGHDGVVLATTDGGLSWVKKLDGKAAGKIMADYYAAHPPADLPGGAEAMAQFQRDVKRIAEEGADKPFLAVWFESESTGYVVGLFNLIFKTTDGGKSWIPLFDQTDNPKRLHFYAIHPLGSDVFLAGEQGMVLKLDQNGQRFRSVPVDYKGTFFGFVDNGSSLLVFGLRGNVFRSADRGVTWQKVETGVAVAITAATRLADGRVVLLSQAGHALASADGGQTFTQLEIERSPTSAVVSITPQQLVVVGTRGIHVKPIK